MVDDCLSIRKQSLLTFLTQGTILVSSAAVARVPYEARLWCSINEQRWTKWEKPGLILSVQQSTPLCSPESHLRSPEHKNVQVFFCKLLFKGCANGKCKGCENRAKRCLGELAFDGSPK